VSCYLIGCDLGLDLLALTLLTNDSDLLMSLEEKNTLSRTQNLWHRQHNNEEVIFRGFILGGHRKSFEFVTGKKRTVLIEKHSLLLRNFDGQWHNI
jgi:hypothetical protein